MSAVRFEQNDTLGRIILSNPPFNFVGAQYNKDLITAVHDASESDIRALLIQSEGPNFSVGGAVHEWTDMPYHWFRTFVAEVTASYRALEALRFPVVAAIRGQTTGGGLELALSADFIVASENTVLWCVEVNAAQIPLAGGYQRLASLIGPGPARRMVMLGERTPISAVPGIADHIVPDDELDKTAFELATRLSKGPTYAYAAAKSVLKAWWAGGIPEADNLMLDLAIDTYNTEDARMGFAAGARVYKALLRGQEPRPDDLDFSSVTYTGH